MNVLKTVIMMAKIPCPDCKALVPDIQHPQPQHKYIGGCPGCWQIYGEILGKEFSDPEYFKVHRLSVDAYLAQHPGKPGRQSSQSVNVHLLALYLILEKELAHSFATKALGCIIEKRKDQFEWLSPPASLGEITVIDVVKAKDATEHQKMVEQWARSVSNAWKPHHETIKQLAKEIL